MVRARVCNNYHSVTAQNHADAYYETHIARTREYRIRAGDKSFA